MSKPFCIILRILFLFPLLAMFTGCLCDPEYCRMPDLFRPGHISEQRERMEQFDPFTSTGAGPAIVGDRPNGCTVPVTMPRYLKNRDGN